MNSKYFSFLKEEIKNYKFSPRNGTAVLAKEKWTKKSFEVFATYLENTLSQKLQPEIARKIGVSLSSKTLSKFLADDFKLSNNPDTREIATLDKLCYFLDYEGWMGFVSKKSEFLSSTVEEQNTDEILASLVEHCCEREFQLYKSLPAADFSKLNEIFHQGSPYLSELQEVVASHIECSRILSNLYNPSNFAILEINISQSQTGYIATTKEFWLLCWWDQANNKYSKRIKSLGNFTYLFKVDHTSGNYKIKHKISEIDNYF